MLKQASSFPSLITTNFHPCSTIHQRKRQKRKLHFSKRSIQNPLKLENLPWYLQILPRFERFDPSFIPNASSGNPEVPSPSSSSSPEQILAFLSAFWKFLRPHTIRGTIIGSMSVTMRAVIENPAAINWMLLPRALIGVLTLLCGNGFIVGINQIYDIQIDEVAKRALISTVCLIR